MVGAFEMKSKIDSVVPNRQEIRKVKSIARAAGLLPTEKKRPHSFGIQYKEHRQLNFYKFRLCTFVRNFNG